MNNKLYEEIKNKTSITKKYLAELKNYSRQELIDVLNEILLDTNKMAAKHNEIGNMLNSSDEYKKYNELRLEHNKLIVEINNKCKVIENKINDKYKDELKKLNDAYKARFNSGELIVSFYYDDENNELIKLSKLNSKINIEVNNEIKANDEIQKLSKTIDELKTKLHDAENEYQKFRSLNDSELITLDSNIHSLRSKVNKIKKFVLI